MHLVDPDLIHLLEEELQFENSDEEKAEAPAFVKEFLEANLFQVRQADLF
jgi:complement component 1 Q subcomponent-binding protein